MDSRYGALIIWTFLLLGLLPLGYANQVELDSQEDWNNGSFDGASADRPVNSGSLAIGYLNGTSQDSLNGYWRLDSDSGAVIDYSGLGNNGDIFGAARGVSGVLGTKAADFDGNADEVIVPDDNSLDLENGFTINLWVNPDEKLDIDPSMSRKPELAGKGSPYRLVMEEGKTIAYSKNSELRILNGTGKAVNLGVSTNVTGSLSDFDNDGKLEVPYVDSSGNLEIVDRDLQDQQLVSGSAETENTVLGTGDLDNDGRSSVFYVDSSTQNVMEYDFSDSTKSAVGSGIAASAVLGVSDFGGDGNSDLVFVDDSKVLSWYDGSGVESTGVEVTGGGDFQFWLGGTSGPATAKYNGSWESLSSGTANGIYAGAQGTEFFYLGGGSGEFTKYDGTFQEDDAPFGNQFQSLTFNGSHVIGVTGNGDVATYNEGNDQWTEHNPNLNAGEFYSSASSYGGEIGEYWLIGHPRTGGATKSYISRFDGSNFQKLTGSTNVFGATVQALEFNGTHYLGGDDGGDVATYDGSGFESKNSRLTRTDSVYAVEYGEIDGKGTWAIGGASSRFELMYDNGTSIDLTNDITADVYSIGYSEQESSFLIGGDSGSVFKYNSSGLYELGNAPFSNNVHTIEYNPESSAMKVGRPSDQNGDGEVRVPLVTEDSNLGLVNSSGDVKTLDSNYGGSSATPLGTVDWKSNPDQEIIHINSDSGELYLSDLSGKEQAINYSNGTKISGIDTFTGVSAGSTEEASPVLEINGQNALKSGTEPLPVNTWTMITAKYNASEGTAELLYNSSTMSSTSVSFGTLNLNTDNLQVADGVLNADIDEVRIYNRSVSSESVGNLFFQGTDGRFDGSYDSQEFTPEEKRSWNNLSINLDIPAETAINSTVYALDYSGNVINSVEVEAQQGENNYSLTGLENSERLSLFFSGYSDNVKKSWEISSASVYSERSMITGNLTNEDYSYRHRYNISATAQHADSDANIAGCTAYYKTSKISDYYTLSEGGGSSAQFSNSGFGSDTQASCNGTISPELFSVGYGSGDADQVSFYIQFEDQDGYTVETVNKTQQLPNNHPEIQDVSRKASPNSHSFNFSSVGFDADNSSSEIESCRIVAEDSDGNTYETGDLNTSFGTSDQASCNSSISNSVSGFEVGESIEFFSEFTDKTGEAVTSSIYTEEIPNHDPVVEDGPNFDDAENGHEFDASAIGSDVDDGESEIELCTVYAEDEDGNIKTFSGSDYLDTSFGTSEKASCNATISSSISGFEVGETITTRVKFTDAHGAETPNSTDFHTIPNHVPTQAENLNISYFVNDTEFITDHTPEFNFSNPSDPDDDGLTVEIFVESSPDPSNLETSFELDTTGYNDEKKIEIGNNRELSDGTNYNVSIETCDEYGACNSSENLGFRMNAKPSINSVELNNSNPAGGDSVQLDVNITDKRSNIKWTNFTVWNQDEENLLIDNENGTHSGDSWNSSNWTMETGDVYNYTVTGYDGYEKTSTTGSLTADNAIPSIISDITFSDYQNAHRFNVSAVVSDDNGDDDIEGYNITLDDGEKVKIFTGDVNRSFGDSKQASANFSNVNSSIADSFDVGETVEAEIKFYDAAGSTASTSAEGHVIPNRPPELSNVEVKPSSGVETDQDLNVSYDVTDPESDSIDSQFYRWYRNSEDSGVTTRVLDSNEIEEGETWNITVRVEDQYGSLSDLKESGNNVQIQNSPPEVLENTSFENKSGSHSFQAEAAFKDLNNQSDIEQCKVVYSDGENQKSTTLSFDTDYGNTDQVSCASIISTDNSSWIDPGDQIDVNITVSDEVTSASTEKTNTVPNSKPSVNLEEPLNDTKKSNSTVEFNWTGSDPEGDNLSYQLNIYNQTAKIQQNSTDNSSLTVDLDDGEIQWNVTVTDSWNGTELSENYSITRTVLVDTVPPEISVEPDIEVIDSNRDTPKQNQSVKCYSQWSDNFELDYAKVYENSTSTNHTINSSEFSEGWANTTIESSDLKAGTARCDFHAFDSLNNSNSSEIEFEVVDIEKPNITEFNYSPQNQQKLDPDKPVEINATVTDNLNLDNVSLLYRKQGGNWKLGNISSQDDDLYTANFTPQENDTTYEFKYRANDTYGNIREVNDSVYIDWDYGWESSPEEFEGSNTLEENLVDYRPLSIYNTGDFNLSYSIEKQEDSNLDVSLGKQNISVAAGESESVSVKASLEDNSAENEGIYSFELELNAANSTAEPVSRTINGTATFTLDSAFLSMDKGSEFPLSVTQGEKGVELPVETSNIGTEKAVNSNIEYQIPDDWELVTNSTSQELGNISVDETKNSSIKVDISDNASKGTRKVNLNASTSERNFSETFEIDVNENSETSQNGDDGSGGGGGGGGGSSGGQGAGGLGTEQKEKLFQTREQTFSIVRGQDQEFRLKVENPFEEGQIENVSLTASGFVQQYLNIEPDRIEKIPVNESKNFSINVEAPEYFTREQRTLNLTIRGINNRTSFRNVDNRTIISRDTQEFRENRLITLVVHEISRDEADDYLNRSEELLQKFNSSEVPVNGINRDVEEAKNAFEEGDYQSVRQISNSIEQKFELLSESQSTLSEVRKLINDTEKRGIDSPRTKRMVKMAELAIERGDFASASERASEARNLHAVETEGKFNFINALNRNWEKILGSLIVFVFIGSIIFYKLKLFRIKKKIGKLESQQDNIKDLIQTLQRRCFKENQISLDHYHESLEQHEEELTENMEEIIRLESKKIYWTNWTGEKKRLKQERSRINNLIEQAQREYFKENNISERLYETKLESLQNRLAEVEEQLAIKEAEERLKNHDPVKDKLITVLRGVGQGEKKLARGKSDIIGIFKLLKSKVVRKEKKMAKETTEGGGK